MYDYDYGLTVLQRGLKVGPFYIIQMPETSELLGPLPPGPMPEFFVIRIPVFTKTRCHSNYEDSYVDVLHFFIPYNMALQII